METFFQSAQFDSKFTESLYAPVAMAQLHKDETSHLCTLYWKEFEINANEMKIDNLDK